MKKYLITLTLLWAQGNAIAQNGWVPPVNFNGTTNICNTTPYKLVFYDEFTGTQLNQPWITFGSWSGMPGGDNPNWNDARKVNSNAIMLDQNVVVSNGTVKLLIKNEHATWKCDTCAESTRITRDFTVGQIAIPYTKGFNNGRFEAKIKFPTNKKSWAAFWLWYGSSVNEIDIAEAIGGRKNWPYVGEKAHAKTTYGTHAWEPKPNPYNLPENAFWQEQYPKQDWWNFAAGNNFKQGDWHTYTCEWDDDKINYYLDGTLEGILFKYYKMKTIILPPSLSGFFKNTKLNIKVPAPCTPSAGNWEISPGYAYNTQSNSQLRLGAAMEDQYQGDPNAPVSTLGQMEVDYVKIWQRNPENGWADLCDPHNITINGPDVICSTATYTSSLPNATGYWSGTSPNLTTLSSTGSAITVQKVANTPGDEGFIYYYPNNPACPSSYNFLQWKRVFVGTADNATVTGVKVTNQQQQQVYYQFHADPHYTALPNPMYNYNSPTTYEWDIYYGPNLSLHQHVWGQTVSTPWHSYTSGTTNKVQWNVKITNACGTVTKSGQQSFYLLRKVPNSRGLEEDARNAYFVADLPEDVSALEDAIRVRASQTFIAETGDEALDEMVARERLEYIALSELEPYIVFDSSDIENMNKERRSTQFADLAEKTSLYPNPASSLLNIELGSQFNLELPVTVRIYDMLGKLQKVQTYEQLPVIAMDIYYLPPGTYSVSIQQDKYIVREKLVKTK